MPLKRNTGEMPGQSRCGDFVSFFSKGSAPPETVSHWKQSFREGRPERGETDKSEDLPAGTLMFFFRG